MTLMQRRRALMAKGGAVDPTLVYELKNRTFNNDESVNTGIPYLTTDKSFTIMCDANFAGQQSGQSWRLINMMSGVSPYPGVAIGAIRTNSDNMMVVWITAKNETGNIPLAYSYVGNVKIVLTHSAGSGSMTYYVKVGGNAVVTSTLSAPFISVTANLFIGGNRSGSSKFNGTVNLFALYDIVKSSAEINAFLA